MAAVIRKAIIKGYDAASHRATVQIAGSLGVWLSAIRVATNIPAADVVPGRQCTVLFLDPANQDDAVIIAVQGALPSTGELLQATATADLTLSTSAASITGDGDSSKVRLLLPTPGDWEVEATCDFQHTVAGAGTAVGDLFVNDSGSPETANALLEQSAVRATVVQRWKVTTTVTDTPVELKARKTAAGGTAKAMSGHTRLTASGVKRATGGGGVSDHGALTGLADDDHPQYGALAQAETWALLQTFSAGLQLAASQAIKDSGGADRIVPKTTTPHLTLTGDVQVTGGQVSIGEAPSGQRGLNVAPIAGTISSGSFEGLRVQPGTQTLNANNISFFAVTGLPQVSIASGKTGSDIQALNFTLGITGSGAAARLASVVTKTLLAVYSGTITALYGSLVQSPQLVSSGSAVITTAYGADIENQGNSRTTLAIGLRVQNQTGATTNYNVEVLGATVTLLRVANGDPSNPGAGLGRSQLLLSFNENGTINLRRVEWKNPDGTGHMAAADKVLVAV